MADNVFSTMAQEINAGVANAMREGASEVCEEMKSGLIAGGHAGTGALIDSINCEVTETDGEVSVSVQAADYATFIENGTGAAHGVEGGREGSWRYQDRNGNWHTTDGMDADPFIEPAVENVMSNLSSMISEKISASLRGGGSNG